MSRPLRVEYPGAIYHVMCSGNARQRIIHNEPERQHLADRLAHTVGRFGWELFSFLRMPNHYTTLPSQELQKRICVVMRTLPGSLPGQRLYGSQRPRCALQ